MADPTSAGYRLAPWVGPEGPARDELARFLERSFGRPKAAFLLAHGAWWTRSSEDTEHRQAILAPDGSMAACSATIPVRLRLPEASGPLHEASGTSAPKTPHKTSGTPVPEAPGTAHEASGTAVARTVPALWWVDLVVAPKHRGRGLQSLLDREVRRRAAVRSPEALLLGFPNPLAAAIHRRHGWGVRDDLTVLLLPLAPRAMPSIRRRRRAAGAVAGFFLGLAAGLATPAARLWAAGLGHRGRDDGRWAVRSVVPPDDPTARARLAEELAAVARHPLGAVTLARDARHFAWRYLEGPHRHELRVHLAGPAGGAPQVAAIVRHLHPAEGGGRPVARLLDLVGDVTDRRLLRRLVATAAGAAARAGASQMTALAALPGLARSLLPLGFLPVATGRFCWDTPDRELHRRLGELPHHWCLGDSDHDEPEAPAGPSVESAEGRRPFPEVEESRDP